MNKAQAKKEFSAGLADFANSLGQLTTSDSGQWTIKGFIDLFRKIYTISADTKVVSKVIEIHLYPSLLAFGEENGYALVIAAHQNYYPDITYISKTDERVKFAVDFKTTYRNEANPDFCNGFTLGSHGEYFKNRSSTKNIQYPYRDYVGHFCLGVIYSRLDASALDDVKVYTLDDLEAITSVIGDLYFFVQEKWRIASDKRGSGNTANIGSIIRIDDIVAGRGMFSRLGEEWFDDYWTNYGNIMKKGSTGEMEPIRNLKDFVQYRGGNVDDIVPKATPTRRRRR